MNGNGTLHDFEFQWRRRGSWQSNSRHSSNSKVSCMYSPFFEIPSLPKISLIRNTSYPNIFPPSPALSAGLLFKNLQLDAFGTFLAPFLTGAAVESRCERQQEPETTTSYSYVQLSNLPGFASFCCYVPRIFPLIKKHHHTISQSAAKKGRLHVKRFVPSFPWFCQFAFLPITSSQPGNFSSRSQRTSYRSAW